MYVQQQLNIKELMGQDGRVYLKLADGRGPPPVCCKRLYDTTHTYTSLSLSLYIYICIHTYVIQYTRLAGRRSPPVIMIYRCDKKVFLIHLNYDLPDVVITTSAVLTMIMIMIMMNAVMIMS